MKTILSLILIIVSPLASLAVFQSDSEILWRILKDWFFVIGAIVFIAGIFFAAWRGNSYKELERLAATRKEEIADLTARLARRDERIRHLEDEAEFERVKKLRQQGDEDYIHRSKS